MDNLQDVRYGSHVRRNVKDTVFTSLFSNPEYALKLYEALHPEDSGVTEEDIEIVTLEPVIASGLCNDLGLTVGNRVLVLMEAQSTWTGNIAMRMLLYAAKTYLGYTEAHKINLHSSRTAAFPRPEIYVVYTGNVSDIPETLSLRDDIFGGSSDIDVSVRVLREGTAPRILGEYVAFARLWDGIRTEMGSTPQAAKTLVRQCLERGILTAYIATRQTEVADMLVQWNDQEEIDRLMREEARQEGRADILGLVVGQLRLTGSNALQAVETLVSVYGVKPSEAEELVARNWQ